MPILFVTIIYLLSLNDAVMGKFLTLLNSVKAKMRIVLALFLVIAVSGLLIIHNCDYLMIFVSKSLNCCVNFFSNIFIYLENFLTVCLEVAAMIYFLCFLFKSIWVRFITCKEAKVPSKTTMMFLPETNTEGKITEASCVTVVNCSVM